MNADHLGIITPSLASRLDRRQTFFALLALGLGPQPIRGVSARQAAVEPTLLARGDAELDPGALVAWRVVQDVAAVGSDAAYEERALGFAVAPVLFTSLLLTDEATGKQVQLDPQQAAFVPAGTSQRIESLGETAQGYLRLELVEVTAAGADRLLFLGTAFPAPSGSVALSLHRVEPVEGEAVGLPPGAGATLLLVEQGEVWLEEGETAPPERLQTVVGCGTSYAIRSVGRAATLFGGPAGTRVLIATIV